MLIAKPGGSSSVSGNSVVEENRSPGCPPAVLWRLCMCVHMTIEQLYCWHLAVLPMHSLLYSRCCDQEHAKKQLKGLESQLSR